MKSRSLPVLIVAILLIVVGVVGFIYHLGDFSDPNQELYITISVEILRIIAIITGVLLLRKINLGRWLAVGWVALHVIISAFNSVQEMLMHLAILIIITVLLFLPSSSAYFRQKVK
jgi:hypothetical protein